MRIAMLTASYYPFIGGAERFAQEVAEHFVRKGHSVDVITLRQNGKLSKQDLVHGVTLYRIDATRARGLFFLQGYLRLVRTVARLDTTRRYDLIHSIATGLPSQVGTTMKKLRHTPHLITIQGGSLTAGFPRGPAGSVLRQLQEWSFGNSDCVHVISRKLAQEARKLGGRKVIVLPNGVDEGPFHPMEKERCRHELGFSRDERIVVCVARLVPVKGVDYLIRAVADAARAIPNLRLLVIGEGGQRTELAGLIGHLQLQGKVQLLGALPNTLVPQYLGLADVFVLPSLHEGLGIALLEAMACGVPVVGSNVDGIVDIVEHGKNGVVVPPANPQELAKALVGLLSQPEIAQGLALEGQRTVRERFLWKDILGRLEQLYAELAHGVATA